MPVAILGNGRITGLSVGGLPAGTVAQATLATGVAGTGPAFSAYQSAAQSLASGTVTKLLFQTEEFDTAGAFDSTTNYRFQPTVAGYYSVSGGVAVASTATTVQVHLYKNGTFFKRLQSGAGTFSAHGAGLVYLNGTTDYLELWGSQGAAAQNTLTGLEFTYFQGFLARAA